VLLVAVSLSLFIAGLDWWSVALDRPAVEAIAKPLVMVPLIVAALATATDPTDVRWLLTLALLGGLLGDIMLLPRFDRFITGLGAFLIGHLFYVGAFLRQGVVFGPLAIGLLGSFAILGLVGRPILRAVAGGRLADPVRAYVAVIAIMVATGVGTGRPAIALGAILFAGSDGLLGHDRFVEPRPRLRPLVHILYHLGQIGIVVGLLRA
jgi:uncharacterized membrane protein YhhN